MAEMTAEKAVEWLTSDKAFGQECYSRKQIAAMIQQQAAEIAKKDRMLERSIKWHEMCHDCDNCHRGFGCCLIGCGEAWRKWLEKEAQGGGVG